MTDSGRRIVINTRIRKLYFYKGNTLVKTYPIAVGKPSTPTPKGNYKVINKIMNPGGVLGTRWMGLNIPGGNYGIHGTNNPNSIGNAVSNGCIRMYNKDVEQLYPLIPINTPVQITGESAANSQPTQPPGQHHGYYTVQPGDSLWLISQSFNIPLSKLIEANKLSDPNNIYPGQKIFIP
ncbi:L,D-transpeptidase family protein [Desulfolucanica intricata]|uniref:L,D-transpeptidase family protein n=1 Tax=Desulfolucanica intricata TaxID=1285191 RepID=UPI00082A8332|nr:L,D-transpeptidase family protein [Desulfolucanica intricata]